MNKKISIILLVVSILILSFFGWIFWQAWEEHKKGKESNEIINEKFEEAQKISENLIITETPDYKLAENKKIGVSLKLPKDWRESHYTNDRLSNVIDLRSYDFGVTTTPAGNHFKGCSIFVEMSYNTTSIQSLLSEIDEIKTGKFKKENTTIIKIANREGFKTVAYYISDYGSEKDITVSIPLVDKSSQIDFKVIAPEENPSCLEEFNKLLNSLTIQ